MFSATGDCALRAASSARNCEALESAAFAISRSILRAIFEESVPIYSPEHFARNECRLTPAGTSSGANRGSNALAFAICLPELSRNGRAGRVALSGLSNCPGSAYDLHKYRHVLRLRMGGGHGHS